MARKPIDDYTFKAILSAEMRRAVGYIGGELNTTRADATRAYYGEPDSGNLQVIDGRSRAMSLDFRDTVEWLLPDLLRIFTAGERYATFEPVGPEDVSASEQETDVVNQVILKDNAGFSVYYTWFKDALMYKNGFVKYWWDDYPDTVTERFKGMTDVELNKLLSDDGVEIVGKPKERMDPAFEQMAILAADMERDLVAEMADLGERVPVVYDVTVRRQVTGPTVCIEPLPPEEFLISAKAKTIKDSPFTAHRVRMTASWLHEMGVPEDVIASLPSYDQEIFNPEREARYSSQENFALAQSPSLDPAMREIWVTEAWIRCDRDGDGYAELVHVKFAGMDATTIIEEEEADYTPICSLCPIPVQHKIFGLSIYDLVKEIQEIKSTLWRAALDNLYFAINGRWELPEDAMTEFTVDDLLSPRPGSFVRTAGAGGMLKPLATPLTGDLPFRALEYAEAVKEERTGVTRYNQGMDAGSLNKTATGVSMITRAANVRKELIARIFAETGVKELMLGIHRVLRAHADDFRKRAFRMRGKWVEIDPSAWSSRNDMTVEVGLGTENKDAMLGHLNSLGGWLSQIIQAQGGIKGPLVGLRNIYNFVEDFVKNAGLPKLPNRYINDPTQAENAPPPQRAVPPEVQLKMAQMKLEADRAARDDATKRLGIQLEHRRGMAELKLRAMESQATHKFDVATFMKEIADADAELQGAAEDRELETADLHLRAADMGRAHAQASRVHVDGISQADADRAMTAEQAASAAESASQGGLTVGPA